MSEAAAQSHEAFASAGSRQLLDRELPEAHLREWTERIAAEKTVAEAGTISILIFRLGAEWLALPTSLLQEVAQNCPSHSLPRRPHVLAVGLITIRGEIVVCADLGAVLGIAADPPTATATRRHLVVSRHGERLAFPVDDVATLHRYHPRELRPAPATLAGAQATHTLGLLPWREHTVGCLDEERLFQRIERNLA